MSKDANKNEEQPYLISVQDKQRGRHYRPIDRHHRHWFIGVRLCDVQRE